MKNPWETFGRQQNQNNTNVRNNQRQSTYGFTGSNRQVTTTNSNNRWSSNNSNNNRNTSSWSNNSNNRNRKNVQTTQAPPMYRGSGEVLPTYHGPQMYPDGNGGETHIPTFRQHVRVMAYRSVQVGVAHALGHFGEQLLVGYLQYPFEE